MCIDEAGEVAAFTNKSVGIGAFKPKEL